MNIGSLGDIVFETSYSHVFTPRSFDLSRKARFEEHQVIGAMPRLEFLSPELATISLPISLRADLGISPVEEFERIDGLCKEGKALRLILAGINYGFFVIESYSQHHKYASGQKIFSMDINLSLKEYVKDNQE